MGRDHDTRSQRGERGTASQHPRQGQAGDDSEMDDVETEDEASVGASVSIGRKQSRYENSRGRSVDRQRADEVGDKSSTRYSGSHNTADRDDQEQEQEEDDEGEDEDKGGSENEHDEERGSESESEEGDSEAMHDDSDSQRLHQHSASSRSECTSQPNATSNDIDGNTSHHMIGQLRTGGKGNSIDQIDPKTGIVLAHFSTGVEASYRTGVQRILISRACHRTGGSPIGLAAGFIWNFHEVEYKAPFCWVPGAGDCEGTVAGEAEGAAGADADNGATTSRTGYSLGESSAPLSAGIASVSFLSSDTSGPKEHPSLPTPFRGGPATKFSLGAGQAGSGDHHRPPVPSTAKQSSALANMASVSFTRPSTGLAIAASAKKPASSSPNDSMDVVTNQYRIQGLVQAQEAPRPGQKYGRREGDNPVVSRKRIEQLTMDGNRVCIYDSGVAAAALSGIARTSISATCRGKLTEAGGFLWRFVDDNDEPLGKTKKHAAKAQNPASKEAADAAKAAREVAYQQAQHNHAALVDRKARVERALLAAQERQAGALRRAEELNIAGAATDAQRDALEALGKANEDVVELTLALEQLVAHLMTRGGGGAGGGGQGVSGGGAGARLALQQQRERQMSTWGINGGLGLGKSRVFQGAGMGVAGARTGAGAGAGAGAGSGAGSGSGSGSGAGTGAGAGASAGADAGTGAGAGAAESGGRIGVDSEDITNVDDEGEESEREEYVGDRETAAKRQRMSTESSGQASDLLA